MSIFNKIKYLCFMPAVAALAAYAGAAGAVGGLADVTVYDRVEHRTLPIHHHNGRYYVVGKPGNEYQIRVHNRARNDILSVVSVDGVNVVSGETAHWSQTGYVLGAHQGFDIRGWRKSMDRIAAFYFTEHQNSYAARTGRPNNVGVIGVALFRKKFEPPVRIEPPVRPIPLPRPPYPYDSPFPQSQDGAPGAAMENERGERSADSATAPAPAAPAGAMRERAQAPSDIARAPQRSTLGTGHGRSEHSQATYTHFERASSAPAEVITIHYDTYENLLALGVITQPPVYARPTPTPFPGQFVPDPR